MEIRLKDVVDAIAALPEDWHGAGSVTRNVLDGHRAARHRRSLRSGTQPKPGAGKTTLLLSHLSRRSHGLCRGCRAQYLASVKASPIFEARHDDVRRGTDAAHAAATHVRSTCISSCCSTDRTAIRFQTSNTSSFIRRIETGGLLILDDLKIPSIGRMFDIVKEEAMFEFARCRGSEHRFSASNRRQSSINPETDSWWLQGYNRPYYEEILGIRK